MDDDALAQILEAWRTNHRINELLIDTITPEGMECTLSTRGGRNVVRQLAHLHNVRLQHLEKRGKDLAEGLRKFATKEEPDTRTLKRHMKASTERMERFFEDCVAGVAKRRPFRKGVLVFLAYLVAHESHHRGSILLTLKQSGHAVPKDVAYAIWDWDRR